MSTDIESPDFDPAAYSAQLRTKAQDADALETAKAATAANSDGGVLHWVKNLPKNLGIGLMDAAINTLDAGVWIVKGVGQNVKDAVTGQSPSVKAADAAKNQPAGALEAGNIDLAHRPVVHNPDGTISTVHTIGIGEDTHQVVIPTISPDGKQLSNDEAIALYKKTGQHLGKFDSIDNAKAYAIKLHEDQAKQYEESQAMQLYNGFKSKFMAFRDKVAQNETMVTPMGSWQTGGTRTSDEVTRGIAQFALPFMAWTKLLGGVSAGGKALSLGRAAVADAATSMTVLQPHDPRMADLVALGKQSEGKLGEVLNTLAPDGSLVNKYIDYMTDRTNESEAAGRLKNALDSFSMGAAFTGVLESGIVGMKLGRQVLESTPKVGPGAQGGHLGKVRSLPLVTDSARARSMLDQVYQEFTDGKIDFATMHERTSPLHEAYWKARRAEEFAASGNKVREVYPGFREIPVGTKVSATHGLKYPEATSGTVVGTKKVRLNDGHYWLPKVDFGDGEPRTLLPHNVHEIYAPRPVKE